MGGARNCSFISAHFLLSAHFLAAQTYKRMRLITRVYGIAILGGNNGKNRSILDEYLKNPPSVSCYEPFYIKENFTQLSD